MNVRIRVFISGKVQGVFFRSEVAKEALSNGVTGWIQNLHDGRVEAVFEGEAANVKKLLKFCRKSPSQAKVTGINALMEAYVGEFNDFKVKDDSGFR